MYVYYICIYVHVGAYELMLKTGESEFLIAELKDGGILPCALTPLYSPAAQHAARIGFGSLTKTRRFRGLRLGFGVWSLWFL